MVFIKGWPEERVLFLPGEPTVDLYFRGSQGVSPRESDVGVVDTFTRPG